MIIRDAYTPDDVDALVEFGRQMWANSRYRQFNFDKNKLHNLIMGLYAQDNGIALVAEDDGSIVGGFLGAVASHFFGNDLSAMDFALFVHPLHRRDGVAAALVAEYVRQAKRIGAVDIGLGVSVGGETEELDHLYKASGFLRVGGNYRLVDMAMEKTG